MKKTDFIEKWIDIFGKELKNEDYNYLWEAFFFKPKEKFLSGINAKKEFFKMDRKGALCIEMWFDDETQEYDVKYYDEEISNGEGIIPELFIVSKDWSWSYVCSHEDDDAENGPFFIYNENR